MNRSKKKRQRITYRRRTNSRHRYRTRGLNLSKWIKSFNGLDSKNQIQAWQKLIDSISRSRGLDTIIKLRDTIESRIKVDILSKVPYELTTKILSYLDPKDICRVAQTCRYLRGACQDNQLWMEKCKNAGLLDDEFIYNLHIEKQQNNDQHSWKQIYKNHLRILNNWRKPARVKRLKCHEDHVITCLQFNPISNIIVSGSDDSTLRVWRADTGECIRILEGHKGGVWCSQITSEDIVISGSTDRTLKIWEPLVSGQPLHTLQGHTSTVRCIALNRDEVVSGSRDKTLRLWHVISGRCLHVFSGHTDSVRCVEFKNDIIVSGAYDHLVKVWDANTGSCIHTLQHHTNRIYCLQLDGDTIASGSLDKTICIWDVKTGKLRHELKGHDSLTSKMQLKNSILVSANADSFCKVWDVETGSCLHTLGGDERHTSAITSVYFNNWNVVTSGDDGSVKLWDLKTGKFISNLIQSLDGGVVWRIRASYTKLICAVGNRRGLITDDTHLIILDLD